MTQVDPVILQLKADVDQYQANLTKAQRHTDDKLDAIEKRGAKMGEGLRKGFDLAKGAAIAFAGALVMDKLGQAISQGLEYASSLGEVSQQLGVTTKDLQFYRFAATQVGLSQEEMDQGLQKLTKSLGEAAQGNKTALASFERLGVSIRDAEGNVRSAGEILPDIAEGMTKLGSDAERSAAATDLFSRAGYKMLPFLSGGAKGVRELAGAYDQMGTALTDEQIKNADEAADAMAKLNTRLKEKIAGIVGDNAGAIIELTRNLEDLADKAERAFQALQSLANTPLGKLTGKAIGAAYEYSPIGLSLKGLNQGAELYMPSGGGGGGRKAMPGTAKPTQNLWKGAKFGALPSAKSNLTESGDGLFGGALGGKPLLDIGAATARVAQLTGELERMSIDLAIAEADLTGSVEARAAAEKRRIEVDRAAEVERITANASLTQAEKDKAIALQGQLAVARAQLVDQQASADLARQQSEARREAYDFEMDALDAERDAATHLGERNAIEQRILKLQQDEETARLEAAIAAGQIADASKARAALARKQSAESTGLANGQQGPGAAYLDSLRMDAEELNAAYEDVAASGLRSLNDGIAEAIMGSKSLGDVFKNVANQIIADLVRIAVQQAITIPLANALFGGGGGGGGLFGNLLGAIPFFASGTSSAPPGLAVVGEKGPELVRFRGGEQVIPNHAIGNMSVAGGGGTVVQRFHLDARGAVMTQDIVNQINAMGQQAAEAGARGGHALASRDIANMRRPKL